ncbi:MAG: hypothetical protein JRJ24_07275 [Deltaproteobacteria bacterium]|nr:hypothetical protein [Deltaproteobacteria bacterium]
MRPRFELQLPVARETWLEALRSALRDDAGALRGQVFRKHAVVEMRDGQRTFWSPYLNLEVEDEPDGSAIRGRFSPHPNVWTMFMAAYILLAIIALGGITYGIVQSTLGQPPWALWIAPAAVALFGFVYGATLIGQGLGAEQMYIMRSVVDRACVDALDMRGNVDAVVAK